METPEEIMKRSIELAEKGGFTEGIYNYCDRWCEKCAHTSKCFSFANSPDPENMTDEESLEYVANNMKATILMIDKMAEEAGIDLSDIVEEELDLERNKPFTDPLTKFAHDVSFDIHKLFNSLVPETGQKIINSLQLYRFEKELYHESVEIVVYYEFFFAVKLERAVRGIEAAKEDDYMIRERDGSAKVALIALDRSIKAWQVIMKERSEFEDNILKILKNLAKVRMMAEKRFPGARSFVRPGLDEFLMV